MTTWWPLNFQTIGTVQPVATARLPNGETWYVVQRSVGYFIYLAAILRQADPWRSETRRVSNETFACDGLFEVRIWLQGRLTNE